MLDVGDGNLVYWEVVRQPGRQARAGRPRRTGLRLRPGHPALLRPGPLPGRPVRPAQLRAQHAARERPGHRHERQHHRHLIADMERLREHLGIDRWLLFGGSWGSTLILAYAQRHPDRVSEIVIAARHHDPAVGDRLALPGRRPVLPRRVGPVPRRRRRRAADGDLVAAYARLHGAPRPGGRGRAARRLVRLGGRGGLRRGVGPTRTATARRRDLTALVRICAHYFAQGAWLAEGELIREAGRLAGIPGC